jgi:hypothetical protein
MKRLLLALLLVAATAAAEDYLTFIARDSGNGFYEVRVTPGITPHEPNRSGAPPGFKAYFDGAEMLPENEWSVEISVPSSACSGFHTVNAEAPGLQPVSLQVFLKCIDPNDSSWHAYRGLNWNTLVMKPVGYSPRTALVRTAFIDINTLRPATFSVFVDNDFVGRTDQSGIIEYSIPCEVPALYYSYMRLETTEGPLQGFAYSYDNNRACKPWSLYPMLVSYNMPDPVRPGDLTLIVYNPVIEPVQNARVFIDGKQVGVTDSNGVFEASVDDCKQSLEVMVSAPGFPD